MSIPKVRITGVYTIENTVSKKIYVGSCATHIPHRWRQHKTLLRKGLHTNQHLQAAWCKYGVEAFVFSVLEEVEPEYCTSAEQFWINTLSSHSPSLGYNLKPVCASQLGFRHSDCSKVKISRGSSSWKRSEAHIAALFRGLQAFIAANGHPNAGRVLTEAHRSAISRANVGNKHGTKLRGRKLSEETKQKMRKPKSPEHRAKIAAAAQRRVKRNDNLDT